VIEITGPLAIRSKYSSETDDRKHDDIRAIVRKKVMEVLGSSPVLCEVRHGTQAYQRYPRNNRR
jgi:hypothetical protein